MAPAARNSGVAARDKARPMRFSETACEILDIFRQTHRRPGARMTIVELDARVGTDPAVAVGASELIHAGYMTAPDAETLELTATGFDAIQLEHYREIAESEIDKADSAEDEVREESQSQPH
jgi:hypothetical protein